MGIGRLRLTTPIVAIVAIVVLPFASSAEENDAQAKTVLGVRNIDLHDGAQELLAGNAEEGIRLTRRGLESALGSREKQAAYSNICAGYNMLHQWDAAVPYCDSALEQNPNHWRALSNRALAYVHLERFAEAEVDLDRGQKIAPQANSLKEVRGLLLDATQPVMPNIEIDDRRDGGEENES